MVANYGGNTLPERLLRSALHQAGLRFRKDRRPLGPVRCRADVVFTKRRVCVFVDGCFWHGCPLHFDSPKTHRPWWNEKIEENRKRDRRQAAMLTSAGWKVIRFWEHEIIPSRLPLLVRTVVTATRRTAARPAR